MSALFVRLHDIEVENDFTVHIKTGATPGNHLSGFTQYNGTYPSITTEITITGLTYDTQYWVKIVDSVNGSYVIENIRTHAQAYYLEQCEVSGVTPTPTYTPTYTPTVTPGLPTPTPTPTTTPTPEVTVAPPPTPTITLTPTKTPTPTPTGTPAPFLPLTKYCYKGYYVCGDTLHEISGHEPYTGMVTYWDEYDVEHTEYYCADDGVITIWSSSPPITVAMAIEECDPPIGCADYGVTYSNYLPGSSNVWEASVYLPTNATTNYTFNITFSATRNDTPDTYNGSINVVVYSGTNYGVATMLSPDSGDPYESWTVTSYHATQTTPSTGGYLFDFCP